MRIRKVGLLIISVMAVLSLSGCAGQMMFGAQARNACETSPVLYTNLTEKSSKRHYELSNGFNCTSYYNHRVKHEF